LSLHNVNNAEHPHKDNTYMMDGTLTITLLVIFLIHHDKILTEAE